MTVVPGTDLDVSPLALGGNVFGGTASQAESFAVLDAYLGAGGNHVDTADVYNAWIPGFVGGESEEVIGRWMGSRRCRDRVVLATKVGMHEDAHGLTPASIRRGLDASLRRLQTDHVDLYYAHRDDPDVPLEETLGTFGELIDEGRVRYVAASNFAPDRLRDALAVSDREALPRFVAFQAHYNLARRERYERDYAPIVADEGLAVFPYFSLASGFLTGKYRPDDAGTGPRARLVARYLGQRSPRILEALEDVATSRGVAMATIALAWLAAQPTVTTPLASARVPQQLEDLLAAADVTLTGEERELLDRASAP